MDHQSDVVVGGKYRIIRKISSGYFADIYVAMCIESSEEVTIKMEKVNACHPQLHYEYEIYRVLSEGVGVSRIHRVLSEGVGVPRMHYYGNEGNFDILVMDLLGPSLEDLFNLCGRHFSIKTILMLTDQMIGRVEYVHAKRFIHRDIKPDNFVMGTGKQCNKLFLTNFGLAKKYNPFLRKLMPQRVDNELMGTARYASLRAHVGIEQSRRDDMESLGYIMIYFNRGDLPWQGIKGSNRKQKCEKIYEKKLSTYAEVLCLGYPDEFAMYLNYCRGLHFEQTPDYLFLRQLFRIFFRSLNHNYDYIYDWTMLKPKIDQNKQQNPSDNMLTPEQRAERDKENKLSNGKSEAVIE